MKIGCVLDRRRSGWFADGGASLLDAGCQGVLGRDLGAVDEEAGQYVRLLRDLSETGLAFIGIQRSVLEPERGMEALGRSRQLPGQYGRQTAAAGADVLVLTGGPRCVGALDGFQELLEGAIALASRYGGRIWVANRAGTCVEQIEELRAVFASPRHAPIRLLLDAGQCYQAAVNPRDVFAELGDWTSGLVLSDRAGSRTVRLGTGRLNVERLVADLVQARYDGWVLVDVPGARRGLWLSALREAVAHVRGLLEKYKHST